MILIACDCANALLRVDCALVWCYADCKTANLLTCPHPYLVLQLG